MGNGIKLCDGKCKNCKILTLPNFRQIYLAIAMMEIEQDTISLAWMNETCEKLSTCPSCHEPNFKHIDGCEINYLLHKT